MGAARTVSGPVMSSGDIKALYQAPTKIESDISTNEQT